MSAARIRLRIMSATSERARFLIIDDHPLFRDALHGAVRVAYPDVETVEAKSISERWMFLPQAGALIFACSI